MEHGRERQCAGGPESRGYRGVVEALNAEWYELVELRPAEADLWRARWREGGDGPELGPESPLADLLARAAAGCDQTLYALLAEARSGDRLAARIVLQSMLGRLVRMARRDGRACVDDYVAAAWCVVAHYPLRSRPERIGANLALETLKAVHRERAGERRVAPQPWPGGERLDLLERGIHQRTLDHGVASRLDAQQVLEAGRRLQLLDEASRLLLMEVYVHGRSGVQVAQHCASTPGSVRVRCSRAVRALAAHAVELAEAA